MKKVRISIVEDEFIVAKDLENVIIDIGYDAVGCTVNVEDAINVSLVSKTVPAR